MVDYSDPKQWRILLIDDEAAQVALMTMMFRTAGITVYGVTDPEEALRVFKAEHPNLVITDLSMSRMNGWQLLEAIRASPEGDQVPVFALTAYSMPDDTRHILEAGFDDHLIKPLLPKTFISEISRRLEKFVQRADGQ